ncbi:hypothetical protein RKE30_25170 [Streptomyces sp. Li-HN-5-11]|uniref:hypothetical protein n=1 Tax=Streptomyces sp. Li-HN-5-11 TaxID=3075432 RepID=UPI0028B17BD4|nr:hypothetical protein [Streptomyces sp. Li-HN-5-11]WNM33442.1 hypothetical protein RKE30_25170 [Streptomyces sp. Li-HN-5-11]
MPRSQLCGEPVGRRRARSRLAAPRVGSGRPACGFVVCRPLIVLGGILAVQAVVYDRP